MPNCCKGQLAVKWFETRHERKKESGQGAALMGRKEAVEVRVRQRAPRIWTAEQDSFIRTHFCSMSATAIGIAIGKSREAVWQRAYKFGLSKNAAMSAGQRERRRAAA